MLSTQSISTQTLNPNHINLIRNQLLQTFNTSVNEVLSRIKIRPQSRISSTQNDIDTEVKQAFINLIENKKTYIIDAILEPFLNESKEINNSFFENRYGFTKNELLECEYKPVDRVFNTKSLQLLNKNKQNLFYIQNRGFKTERTQLKEAEISNGFMRFLRTRNRPSGSYLTDKDSVNGLVKKNKRLSDLLDSSKDDTKRAVSGNIDEKDKIKVAFAEGYVTREKLEDRSKYPFSKIFRLFLNVFFIITLFYLFKQAFPSDISTSPTNTPNGTVPKFRSLFSNSVSEVRPEEVRVKFSDVKGVEEAKVELQEIVDYLKDPEKYTRLGGRLPKGVLLIGPPGTGKTLLAKAVAGEAGVPFFHCNGSEFDEMFVGTGARKMRQLFSTARQRSPCVIFIDEIDSVGAKRTNSLVHPYANQTINQMLAEMDGFERNEGIIVLGATNRRQHLDKALVRPGRFDVEVRVDPPNIKGRIEILDYYLKRIVKSSDIDLELIARQTVGFTGADLENLINQAALKAALNNDTEVRMEHIEWSRERITMGTAKLSRIPDEETNRNTAYHEAGHTIVSFFTKGTSPLHKVTIIPRGMSLGYTAMVPEERELYGKTRLQMIAEIDVLMGGRAAEELIFGTDRVTTGASNDLQRATAIASAMVTKYGMSEKVGLRVFEDKIYEDGTNSTEKLSSQTKETLDQEIQKILHDSYERAKNIIKSHLNELKALAENLLIYETLDSNEIKTLLEGNKLPLTKLKPERQTKSNIVESVTNATV